VKITNYEAPHYAVFFSLLPLPLREHHYQAEKRFMIKLIEQEQISRLL
jgi:hypothetical protein